MARQRSAKPFTAVRIRSKPRMSDTEKPPNRRLFILSPKDLLFEMVQEEISLVNKQLGELKEHSVTGIRIHDKNCIGNLLK